LSFNINIYQTRSGNVIISLWWAL